MPNQEKSQDFELIELLIREAGLNVGASPSTSTQRGNDFESFNARFQSYIDQIPSYLHSAGKSGFFPHFFSGSLSIFLDTQVAEKLGIKEIYFRFDTSDTLKVVVIKSGEIKRDTDAIKNIALFSISEHGSDHQSCKFTSGELEDILKNFVGPAEARNMKDRLKNRIESKLIQISKDNIGKEGIIVGVESKGIDDSATSHKFRKIEKGLWDNPENDIVKLTDSNTDKVKGSIEKILKKISEVHSKYKGSLIYTEGAREAAHHGFIAGALVNFRYRHNLRVYLEQFAGRGYADIVLVPRGKDRSLNATPIIIELKAATKTELKEGKIGEKSGTTPAAALKQAEDYTKGFQPNVMRVLTTANDILCVGVNLDHPSPISDIVAKSRDQKIIPLFNNILGSIDKRNSGKIDEGELKKQIQNNIERIYHTFPGTGEKGDNHYFSRFLLGQSLLLNEVKDLKTSFEKHIFVYEENVPTEVRLESKGRGIPQRQAAKKADEKLAESSRFDESHAVVTMVFIPEEGSKKLTYVMNIIEADGRAEVISKGIPLNKLEQKIGDRKIVELNLNFNIKEQKSDFKKYFSVEVNEPISLGEYNGKKSDKFKGDFKNVPYPKDFKKTFDEVLASQLASLQDQSSSIGKYKKLFGKVGEAMLPFKDLIEKEAHTQAVLHGAFDHYSDIKLGEPQQEDRALILTEFQTGRGKRIDMLVHGIKFAGQANSAKEYDPVGLEVKGPREGKTADALITEANDQITKEYTKGVTYKTLTDGNKVAFMGIVFDKGANNANSLILVSKDEFTPVQVVHSSIFSFSQCATRKRRDIGIPCIDSRDEEKVTKEEKKQCVKELFDIDNAKDLTNEIDIGYEQVFDMIGNADRTDVYVKVKDNDGNDKKLIIGDIIEIRNAERYFVDDYSDGIEILVKVGRNKDHVIKEKIKGQNIEYYLSIDGYKVKFDNIIKDFTDIEKKAILDRLHQLSNDKELLESKKYIEDVGSIEIANQNYDNVISEIKRNLLEKGVRENTFNQFENHFSDLNKKVFAKYIDDVRKNLEQREIEFDHNKFDSAKIKGAKSGKFFSLMAIYDLFDSISDATTLGRHDNDALKQVFGINGILDAMDDVRESISISHNSKIGKLVSKIPQPIRQTFIKVISNPVVQGITFATIAYQFGYSVDEITKGNHHPLNYYWAASSGVKLASMSIKPINIGISSTMKGVSATTKILRGLSAASKVLSKVAAVTMVADILITIGVEIHERVEYTKAIAEQIPLLPGNEQAEVFFAKVIRFFTGRDVEKEYEDKIRVKGYLNHVKEVAIQLLNDNYNIAAVVQYVVSIEEKYSEIIKYTSPTCVQYAGCVWGCELEKKYDDISFSNVNTASNVKNDLSLLNISKALEMRPYTLVMSKGWERFICNVKSSSQCHQDIDQKEVYIVNTDAKHIPHLTKYEYETLGLRIVDAPLGKLMQKPQCSKIINTQHTHGGDVYYPCNTGKTYKECQESFTLSGEPFIFTNPTRKSSNSKKEKMFPKDSVLYISGPKTLTAAANYPAVMHIPEGSNIRYIGSKNNETIFIINNSISGALEGGAGKENTLVMNVKANNVVVNLHEGIIHYGSNNIKLVNTYNYMSNSDSKQNIITHCKTRLINVKNTEVHQGSFDCQDQDYEVRVVNKENVHYRGLKQTIFIVNENSDNAKIVSDLSDTGKENFDVIDVQGANITQLEISEDIGKGGCSLNLLADDMESIVSSTKIDDFKNLVIQAKYQGITESVVIQDKSLSDIVKDIWYQELNGLGKDIDGEVVQNGEKKLKALIQANILDLGLSSAYKITKDIANNNNLNIPVSKIEVTENYMGIPAEKVIIGGVYSDQIIVDFSYNNSDFASSYQRYHDNRGKYDYNRYMIECNHYQDIMVEGGKGQYQYVIKLPGYDNMLKYDTLPSPIRLNLKIKNRAVLHQSIPYDIIDFAELNVMDINSMNIREGERNYINECYNKPISDLTEDSLEIQNITILDSKGIRWSLSIGLIDYLKSPEHQYIILRINNKFYKIDSANLELKHIETNPNFFRYYKPDEQGLQIYHNQPINNNDIGLVDFRDKSILGFDAEVINDSLVLLHKNNTLIKVENWNTYQPAREMIFAFNDTMLSNSKCIISTCNSEDIIGDLNKEKVVVLKNQMFNAIVQNNISEAEDLIRRIRSVDTENKHELTPLYVAIQEGRLDVVKLLFNRGSVNVKDKDIHGCNSLHWAAQKGKLNIAKFLVDKGANTIAEDNNGRTPLRVAACNGNLDMVKFFLNKSVDIESESNDSDKMMGKIESVRKEIVNQADASSNVKRWAKSFIEELRYSIKSKAKRKLSDNISSNCSASTTELTNRIYNFDKNLFDNIIKEVVDDAYGRVDTKKILSCVRSHGYIGQLISGYIAVFDAMQKSGDLNDNAIFKLASYIKEAMENYPKVSLEKRSSLEKLKNRLPKSVRNAVFSSKVCIKNVKHNEYLYAAGNCYNYDKDRRMVFTWIPEDKVTQGVWKIEFDGDKCDIMNIVHNEYLYAAGNYYNYNKDRRMAFTWIPGGKVTQGVWRIEPDGDECDIVNVEHNEYLYAAGNYYNYNKDRRRVFTWIPGGKVTQGVWRIEDCGSIAKRDIVSQGVDINAKSKLNQELLTAAEIGNLSKVEDSINRGADINAKDRDGNTPSRNAALKGHFGIFKYLVENGVSLEGKNHRCGPSICDASYGGNLDILKYLIGKGVDVNESDNNGWAPLHFAAWRGYLEVAGFLTEKGANINVENIFGRKPIHIAAENNNKNIIEFFLSKGMSIDDTDRDGRTPLYYASWNGHLDMVKYLVDKGADIYIQDKGGKTSLAAAIDQKHGGIVKYLKQVQLDRELLIVAQYGNFNEVKDLVSQGASLGAKYSDGWTLMHCAAYGGKLDVVKYLVANEKSSLEMKDNNGRFPLHYAAYNDKLDVVKYFIDEKKIDINIKDNDGWTPLYYASCGHHFDVIKYLDEKHNPNLNSSLQGSSALLETINSNNIEVQDELGRTPLHLAAKVGDWNKVKLLCDYNANIEAQDNFGYTPIFFATQAGKLNVVSLVLYYGANINAQDMYGSTPLHYAAQKGNLGMIQLLLSRCARIELLDRNGWTPILFAARESKWNAVELFVSKGAKFNNEITYQGTPLHFAVREGNLDTVKFLIDKGANIESQDDYNNKPLHLAVRMNRLDIVKFLLDKHANIEARDMDGDIPLELAIQSGYKDIEEVLRQAQLDLDKELLNAAKSGDLDKVKECIKRGAYINTKSSNGRTSLHWAAFEGCLPGVEYLIKEVADINAKDNTSRTPLHYAARNGHLDVVKYLVEEGADFEVKDKDDKTPLDLASWKKHNDVVKYLEKIKEERDKTVQRKRRHHHGDYNRHHNHLSRDPLTIDSSNHPEIASNGGIRSSSWINNLFDWIKAKGNLLTSNIVSPVSRWFIDDQDINATLKQAHKRQMSIQFKPKIAASSAFEKIKSMIFGRDEVSQNMVGFYDEVLGELNKENLKRVEDLCKEIKANFEPYKDSDIYTCRTNVAKLIKDKCDVDNNYLNNLCTNKLLESMKKQINNVKRYNMQKQSEYIRSLCNQDGNIILLTYLLGWYNKIKSKDKEDIHHEIRELAYKVLKKTEICKMISQAMNQGNISMHISEDDIYTSALGEAVVYTYLTKNQIYDILLSSLENLSEIKLNEGKRQESNMIKEFVNKYGNSEIVSISEDDPLYLIVQKIIDYYDLGKESRYKESYTTPKAQNASRNSHSTDYANLSSVLYNSSIRPSELINDNLNLSVNIPATELNDVSVIKNITQVMHL